MLLPEVATQIRGKREGCRVCDWITTLLHHLTHSIHLAIAAETSKIKNTYLVVSWGPDKESVGLLGVHVGDHCWLGSLSLGKGSLLASSNWSLDHGSRDGRSHCRLFENEDP